MSESAGDRSDRKFEGVIPAVLSPFEASGLELDESALRSNVEYLLDHGITTVVVCGTMGEDDSLSDTERERVIVLTAEVIAGRGRMVVGVSSSNATDAIDKASQAKRLGAHGLMCLPPRDYEADERELLVFFSALADASDLPVMLYNNPRASRNDLTPALLARAVADNESIVAVKECSGDARRIAALLELNSEIEVLVGGDDWALEGFCAGSTGWVSGCANVAPAECVQLFELCRMGDLDAARRVNARLLPLARLDNDAKLVQFCKAAQDRRGLYGGPTRPPRLELRDDELARVDSAVAALDSTPASSTLQPHAPPVSV